MATAALERKIEWRADWGGWICIRDGQPLIITLGSEAAKKWKPAFLAERAGAEWGERPEPWIEAAVAALSQQTQEEPKP